MTAANSYTDIAIANLVGTAPEDLNTLEELAQAYKDNKDFAEILTIKNGTAFAVPFKLF